jgi:hypothetical protein
VLQTMSQKYGKTSCKNSETNSKTCTKNPRQPNNLKNSRWTSPLGSISASLNIWPEWQDTPKEAKKASTCSLGDYQNISYMTSSNLLCQSPIWTSRREPPNWHKAKISSMLYLNLVKLSQNPFRMVNRPQQAFFSNQGNRFGQGFSPTQHPMQYNSSNAL